MPKLTWTVLNGATDISSRVLSMSITQGREKYLDYYSGGTCVFTINNANDYANGITYGNVITVSTDGINEFICNFWVQEVVFNDYPGNTGLSTATITAVDWISRAGRVLANVILPEEQCDLQFQNFQAASGGPLPADMLYARTGLVSSVASSNVYEGSVNNYLNFLVMTERGFISLRENYLGFNQRNYVANYPPISVTIGPTTSATQIAYQTFNRIQNGTQFVNTVTVIPEGLSEQTAVNTNSLNTYGPASYSVSTVDYTTTQALGNANWVSNTFSDPASLRFACSFNDRSQNATALSGWMLLCWGNENFVNTLYYQVPGGSITSTNVVLEGFTINVTPEQTTFDLSFSPLTYYQFFTLNSSTLGILDTSRLGW